MWNCVVRHSIQCIFFLYKFNLDSLNFIKYSDILYVYNVHGSSSILWFVYSDTENVTGIISENVCEIVFIISCWGDIDNLEFSKVVVLIIWIVGNRNLHTVL